jgi:hypothetical protein
MMDELESIEIPEITQQPIDDFDTTELELKRAEIEKKRHLLISELLARQKNEENRHLRTVSSIACFSSPPIVIEDRSPLVALDICISKLRETLALLESENIKTKEESDLRALDLKIDALRSELEKLGVQSQSDAETLRFAIESERSRRLTELSSFAEALDSSRKVSENESKNAEMRVSVVLSQTMNEMEELRNGAFANERESRESYDSCVKSLTEQHSAQVLALQESIEAARMSLSGDSGGFMSEYDLRAADFTTDFINTETGIRKELDKFRTHIQQHFIGLNAREEDLRSAIDMLSMALADPRSRDEEFDLISHLEKTLELKTSHLNGLTEEFQECKRQMIAQESVYNLRFGSCPSIAVLRPRTPSRGRKSDLKSVGQRPLSTSHSSRPISLIQNC